MSSLSTLAKTTLGTMEFAERWYIVSALNLVDYRHPPPVFSPRVAPSSRDRSGVVWGWETLVPLCRSVRTLGSGYHGGGAFLIVTSAY